MLQFDTTFYLTTYPDVAAAISRGTIASAQDHYNNFGRFESRNPNAFFDTAFYLAQNPDVAAARVNPLQHFIQFGAAEGRFANNTADAALDTNNNNRADEFNSAAYLTANTDVAANVGPGKAFASAYQHYILFGQFETGRSGVPTSGPFTNSGIAPNTGSTFTLTTGADALTGTAANDTFRGDNTTVQASDTINGGSGRDTFSYTDSSAGGVNPNLTTQSVEVINVRNINGTAAVSAVTETANVVFGALNANETVVIAGRTVTAGANGATAVDVATAFLSGNTTAVSTSANSSATPSGAITNYTGAANGTNGATLSSTVPGNVAPDAANTGTGTASVTVQQGSAAVAGSQTANVVTATNFVGATDFVSDNSTGTVTFNGLVQGQNVGVNGNSLTNNGAVNGNFASAATSATVNVTGGTLAGALTLTGTGLTAATINASGAANTLGAIDLAAVKTVNVNAATNFTATSIATSGTESTLNVTGAGKATLGTLDTDFTTVNASTNTGGISATLSATATAKITGGTGADTFTTGSVLTTGNVDAGAGADTLVVSDSTHLASAALGAKYTNFETLGVLNGVTVDASNIAGITGIQITDGAGATGVTNLTAAQAANVAILAADGANGVITLGVQNATTAGQIDSVSATLSTVTTGSNPAAQAINLTGLTLAGVEKLALTGTGTVTGNTGAVTLTTTNATSLDTITFNNAGNGNTITIAAGHTATNLNVDASASAGSVTINASAYNTSTGAALKGGAGADILLGSAKADVITGGAGNDIIAGDSATVALVNNVQTVTAVATHTAANILTGGAGNDTFAFGLQTANTALVIDTITDLNLGTNVASGGVDKLVFDLATAGTTTAATVVTLTAAQTTAITGATTFAGALDAAITAANGAANAAVQFTYGNDTYIAINGVANGTTFNVAEDHVVKVTGLVGTLDASDIIVV